MDCEWNEFWSSVETWHAYCGVPLTNKGMLFAIAHGDGEFALAKEKSLLFGEIEDYAFRWLNKPSERHCDYTDYRIENHV